MSTIILENGVKIKAPDGLPPEAYDEIVDDAMARFKTPSQSSPPSLASSITTAAKGLAEPFMTSNPAVNILSPAVPAIKSLNRAIEGFQRADTAPFAGGFKTIPQEFAKGASGEAIEGGGLSRIAPNADAQQEAALNVYGPLAPLAKAITMKPSTAFELANDPLNLLGVSIPKTLRGLPKVFSRAAVKKSIPEVIEKIALEEVTPSIPQELEFLENFKQFELPERGVQDTFIGSKEIPKEFKPAIESTKPREQKLREYWENIPETQDNVKGVTDSRMGGLMSVIRNDLGTIEKMGPKGKEIFDRIYSSRQMRDSLSGQWNTRFKDLTRKMTNKQFEDLTRVLRGEQAPNANQTKIVEEINKLYDEVANLSEQHVPNFVRRKNYGIPERGTQEFYQKYLTTHPKQYLEYLRKENAKLPIDERRTEEELGELFTRIKNNQKLPTFGSLTKERLNVIPPEYLRRDKALLAEYFDKAAQQVAESKYLGKDFTDLDTLANEIKNDSDRKFAEDFVQAFKDSKIPKVATGKDKLWHSINTALNVMFLKPTSGLRNFLARGNLFAYEGMNPLDTFKSLMSVYSPGSRRFAEEAGIASKDTVRKIQREAFGSKKGISDLWNDLMGLTMTERGNRVSTADAGKRLAKKFFKVAQKNPKDKFARKILTDLGVDTETALKRGFLVNDDLYKAAYKVTSDIHGMYELGDLPRWMNESAGRRLLHKFQGPMYQQGKFVNQVIKNAIRNPRNSLNLLYLMANIMGSGYAMVKTREKVKSAFGTKTEKQGPLKTTIKYATSGTGLGPVEILSRADQGKGNILSNLVGPSINLPADIISAIPAALPKSMGGRGNTAPLKNVAQSMIPLIGTYLPRHYKKKKKKKTTGRTLSR